MSNYNKITENSGNINHHTFLQRFTLSESSQVYSLTRKNFDNSYFIAIRDEEEHTLSDLDGYKNYYIDGFNIKIIESGTTKENKRSILQKKHKW